MSDQPVSADDLVAHWCRERDRILDCALADIEALPAPLRPIMEHYVRQRLGAEFEKFLGGINAATIAANARRDALH